MHAGKEGISGRHTTKMASQMITQPYNAPYFLDADFRAENRPDYDGKDRSQLVVYKNDEPVTKKDGSVWKKPNFRVAATLGYNATGPDGDSYKDWKDIDNRADLIQDITLHIDPEKLDSKVARAMSYVKEDMVKLKGVLDGWTDDLLRVAWQNHPKWKKKQKESDFENFKAGAKKTVFKDIKHYDTKEEETSLYAKRPLETSSGKPNGIRVWRKIGLNKYERLDKQEGWRGVPSGSTVIASIQLAYYQTSTMYGVHAKLGTDLIVLKMKKLKRKSREEDTRVVAIIEDSDSDDSESDEPDQKRLKV